MRKPVGSLNRVTFPYGATSPPYSPSNPHAGTDYSWYPNLNAYAPEKIKITSIGYLGDCGLAIDAKGQAGRTYRYCHLASDNVSVGQTVGEGNKVGTIGESGNAQGRHLHFVMWVNGTRVDPDKTIKALTKGEEMVTLDQQEVLYRFYLGKAVTAEGKSNIGKKTFKEEEARLKKSGSYKAEVKKAKEGKLNWKTHLPSEMR